jgi:hypothetical protein
MQGHFGQRAEGRAVLGAGPPVGDRPEPERRLCDVAAFDRDGEVSADGRVGQLDFVREAGAVLGEAQGARAGPPEDEVGVVVEQGAHVGLAERLAERAGRDPLDEPAQVL